MATDHALRNRLKSLFLMSVLDNKALEMNKRKQDGRKELDD